MNNNYFHCSRDRILLLFTGYALSIPLVLRGRHCGAGSRMAVALTL
jgi:hypothetical protein